MIKDNGVLLTPYVVNGAFACELYIKGLLLLQGYTLQDLKDLPNNEKHNLADLYARLSDCTRGEIETSVAQKSISSREDFDVFLNDVSKAFVKWRYGYEEQSTTTVENNGVPRIKIVLNCNKINKTLLEIFMICLHDLSAQKISGVNTRPN